MLWLGLVIISILALSILTILQRVLMKDDKSDPVAFSIVFQLLTGVIVGVYALFHGISFPTHFLSFLPNISIMIILYALANIMLFKSLQKIEASEFTILFVSSTFWTILGAVLFLHETFTLHQVIGAVFIALSIVIIFARKHRFVIQKEHIFSLIAALAFGLAFVNDAYLLNYFEVNSYTAFAFIMPPLGIWLLNTRKTKEIMQYVKGKNKKNILITALLQAIATVSIYTAYSIGHNAAVTGSLYKLSTVMIVILGVIFLKERDHLGKKILGVLLACIGAILLVI